MLKVYAKQFNFLSRLFDGLVALLVWLGLYHFRFYQWGPAEPGADQVFLTAGVLIAGLTSYFFNKKRLYDSQRLVSGSRELWTTFEANTLAVVTFVVLLYFFSETRLSRFVVLSYFLTSTTLFLMARFSKRAILQALRRRGRNLRSALLIGHNGSIEDYVRAMRSFKDSGVYFLGWIDSNGLAERYGIPKIETDLKQYRKTTKPDYIVVGYEWSRAQVIEEYLKLSEDDVVPLVVLPDFGKVSLGTQLDTLAGVPAIVLNQPNYSSFDSIAKRSFDVIFSAVALVLLSPFLALIGIVIKLDSKGPIFFRQERVGFDGKKFSMFKFRSMRVDPEATGNEWTVANDPRRTKLGTFLRATSIDELPQLLNVLLGEMSLVGPRPERDYFVEKYRQEIPAYMLRHKVKVGLTGWAQVNGWRGDTCIKSRIECDIYYIQNWSLWLDFKIIFMTIFKGLVNKNAY
jgi:Undecaprenyl-phosphate glucose phosphotransferase